MTLRPSLLLAALACRADAVRSPAADRSDELCSPGGAYTFSVEGTGLSAYEGRRAWASAIQSGRVVVRLAGRVVDGSLRLGCDHGLTEDYGYPGWAVVVDADGNGRCSDGDRGTVREFYGWDWDVAVVVEGALPPVAVAHTVVGDHDAFTICGRYFPATVGAGGRSDTRE